jgi:hypothetical protein
MCIVYRRNTHIHEYIEIYNMYCGFADESLFCDEQLLP